ATAATFEFDPAYGVTDCGELSSDAIQVTSGPTAMSAIRDVEVVDHLLSMRGFDFPLPTVERLPDGRCTVQVVSYGGLRPTATISGRGGRYGLDLVRGFAPQGVGADGGTVQLDVP